MGNCAMCKQVQAPLSFRKAEPIIRPLKQEQAQSEREEKESRFNFENNKLLGEKFTIIEQLGAGSSASVFKVKDKVKGKFKAVKKIKRRSILLKDEEQEFLDELKQIFTLEHPNLAKNEDFYSDERNFYIVTEFVTGVPLLESSLLSGELLPSKQLQVMKQLLEAIAVLHENSIIHRNLTPDNILLDDNLNLKLIDYGKCNFFSSKTKLNMTVGSPIYVAPEAVTGNFTEQSDIWSCGIILHILLLGYAPFSGDSKEELIKNIQFESLNTSTIELKEVRPEAKELLLALLDKEPSKRVSAEEALKFDFFNKTSITTVENGFKILNNLRKFSSKQKLKAATLSFIAGFLVSSAEKSELSEVFLSLDKDGDGLLTVQELKIGLEKVCGQAVCTHEAEELIAKMDADKDGKVSYQEFLAANISNKELTDNTNLRMAFSMFDTNKDGKLSLEEIKEALCTEEIAYIQQFFSKEESSSSDYISFDEFSQLMKGMIMKTIVLDEKNGMCYRKSSI